MVDGDRPPTGILSLVSNAFVEDGHHVHLARNEGSAAVELNATFLARPGTTEYLKTEAEPSGCNV